jgi:hypothetical protein
VAQRCTCGKWQDENLPCVDAIAYYRKVKGYPYSYIMDTFVPDFYRYENQVLLLKHAFWPVVIDTLAKDGEIKPPYIKKMHG